MITRSYPTLPPSEIPRYSTSIPPSSRPTRVLQLNLVFTPGLISRKDPSEDPSYNPCSPPHPGTINAPSQVHNFHPSLETCQISASKQVFKPIRIPNSSPSLVPLHLPSEEISPTPLQYIIPTFNTLMSLVSFTSYLHPSSATKEVTAKFHTSSLLLTYRSIQMSLVSLI